nr:unnamed protein product [Digitaria exilis]
MLSRAASGVIAKPARGFQVFRIDGYSWTKSRTKSLPAGERITSEYFAYKFSLLDASGNAAYELPAETGLVTSPTHRTGYADVSREEEEDDDVKARVGLAEHCSRIDCLAIRCHVGVTEMGVHAVAPKEESHSNARHYGDDYSDWEDGEAQESTSRRRRQPKPLDDKEYVRRSLAKNRGA